MDLTCTIFPLKGTALQDLKFIYLHLLALNFIRFISHSYPGIQGSLHEVSIYFISQQKPSEIDR